MYILQNVWVNCSYMIHSYSDIQGFCVENQLKLLDVGYLKFALVRHM